MIWAKL